MKKEIIRELERFEKRDRTLVREAKSKIAQKYGADFPSHSELLRTYRTMVKNKEVEKSDLVEWLLITRPVRSLSGIVNVTVLTKPYPCPGQCIFCPTENGFPKSYLQGEPAADRAKGVDFDPYLQVTTRLSALKAQGHPTDKVELRIVGGSWNAYSQQYRQQFVKSCFRGANNWEADKKQQEGISLRQAQKQNEKAEVRIVGLSIETRPDLITESSIKELRQLGVTFVEMGVQSVLDEVHELCKTGLTVATIARATKLLKDSGFKILYQVMPNLPGSTPERDKQMFKMLFTNPRFKPDWLKIYPCLVCPDTELHRLWKKGKYTPYTEEELIGLLTEIKKEMPFWVRIARVFRDIPAQKIAAGCRTSNIRERVKEELEKKSWRCNCIRCREVKDRWDAQDNSILFREDYSASAGQEVFLSFENQRRAKLYSYLRLRKGSSFLPVLQNAALIREVQTLGPQIPISTRKKGAQHKGLGSRLIKEAERISKEEWGFSKIAAISGIGVREYYRAKHGYQTRQTYMVKELS